MSFKCVVAIGVLAIAACAQTGNGEAVSVRHFVAPSYPVAAWLARIQGTAVTEVPINADGAVDSVRVTSAYPMFRESLVTALKQWPFRTSMATTLSVTVRFQLDGNCPLTESHEPNKRYYVQTQVSADLPTKIEVKTFLLPTETTKSHHP
jgi:TonB family protein